MKSKVKERADSDVRLEVTIESSTVNEKLDEIYNKMVQELDVPGFRKGKVPRSFVKAGSATTFFTRTPKTNWSKNTCRKL